MSIQSERSLRARWLLAIAVIMVAAICSLMAVRVIQIQSTAGNVVRSDVEVPIVINGA
jgi:hypothetical protein